MPESTLTTPRTPRPPAPRLQAAYHLGYTMWGTTGTRARQYGLASTRLWHDRTAMRWGSEGHADAADGVGRRFGPPPSRRLHPARDQLTLREEPPHA